MCKHDEDCSERMKAMEAAGDALIATFPVPDGATAEEKADRAANIMGAATLVLAKMVVEAATVDLAPGKKAVLLETVGDGGQECQRALLEACSDVVQVKRAEGVFIGIGGGSKRDPKAEAKKKEFMAKLRKVAEEFGIGVTSLDAG